MADLNPPRPLPPAPDPALVTEGSAAAAKPPAAGPSPRGNDPAQQSLADALGVSFWILRIVMIVLVVIYLFSGFYRVPEQEVAVVTRFGQIVTDDQGVAQIEPGIHLGWPFPIDNIITVPVNEQTLALAQAFVYEGEGSAQPLNPEIDGSLITGDANIVHARFRVTYQITDPVAFVTNFGDFDTAATTPRDTYTEFDPGERTPSLPGQFLAEALIRNMVEQGIVHAVAADTADELIGGRFGSDLARGLAQRHLDELDVGITLTSLTMNDPEMPLSVADAYELVTQSEATRSTLINEAESERTRLLGEAGGKAALPVDGGDGPLVRLIKEYEIATTLDDQPRLEEMDGQLAEALRQLAIEIDGESFDIGGETATIINNALIEKSQISERLKTEAETILELKQAFENDPELFKERRWQYVAREIFDDGSGIELIYAPSGQRLFLQMNRDPQIARTRERQRLEADMEANEGQR
jgi:membrane protease subunit HflK